MIARLPGWVWSLADQGLASAATFTASLAVGRLAGADALALYSVAFAAALFVGSIHQALIAFPVTTLAAGLPQDARDAHLARLARWHRTGAWIAVLLTLAALCWPQHGYLAAVGVGCAAARAGIEFRRRAAYLSDRPLVALGASLWAHAPVLGCALIGLLWWLYLGSRPLLSPESTATFALAGLALGAAAGCWLTPVPGSTAPPTAGWDLARAHWRLGRWYLASLMALWATNYAFGWYLAGRGDLREAGYLHAARTLLGLPMAGLLAFDAWFQPRGRAAWVHGGGAALRQVVWSHALLAFAVALPCALLMWCWPTIISSMVFGPDFADAGPALALTAWCVVLAVPDRLLNLLLSARQAPEATAAGFVACLLLTAWLLPRWGSEGAVGCARLLAVNAGAMVVVPGAWLWWRWKYLA